MCCDDLREGKIKEACAAFTFQLRTEPYTSDEIATRVAVLLGGPIKKENP